MNRPRNAERLIKSDYVRRHRRPSRYVSGITVDVYTDHCPRCKREHRTGTRETSTCACGLCMQVWSNALYVWENDHEST